MIILDGNENQIVNLNRSIIIDIQLCNNQYTYVTKYHGFIGMEWAN